MTVFLVTGGAGFIGSHIVEALRQRNEVVRVFDNFSTGKRANLKHLSDVEIIVGDVRDVNAVQQAVAGTDFVIHLAALVSVPQSMSDPASAHAVNVTGTLNILTAAAAHKIKRIVLASSCAVYGDNDDLPLSETASTRPLSPYAASKLMGEIYCQTFYRSSGLPTVCLRYLQYLRSAPGPEWGVCGSDSEVCTAHEPSAAARYFWRRDSNARFRAC